MDVLIIKSTHLEHLDLVQKRIKERFLEATIYILAHQHGAKSLGGDQALIIPYKKKGDFSIFKLKVLRNEEIIRRGFDLVVIPFSNESGAGYLSVISLAFGIKSKIRMSCNMDGRLKRIGYGYLVKRVLIATLISLFATIGTVILTLPILLFIGCRIKRSNGGVCFEQEGI